MINNIVKDQLLHSQCCCGFGLSNLLNFAPHGGCKKQLKVIFIFQKYKADTKPQHLRKQLEINCLKVLLVVQDLSCCFASQDNNKQLTFNFLLLMLE